MLDPITSLRVPLGFHLYDKLPHIFPESCLLITLGILVGVTLYFTETASSGQYSLNANTFFLFLLPPIIYDAGYHMPNRAFFNNIGTILLLAVVNTLWNTMGIGVCLYGMSRLGWINSSISLLHCFVFSSLISAVDPVAVLAIFEEIQVNEILYIIVFGESLLNDGVTVVLYHMMDGFTEIGESNLEIVDFVTGFAQFFIVVIGGTLIGVVYGVVGAFITKYTDHVRVLEPLFVFVLGYLAYLTAESMELSGILALTFGGIVMRHYSELNMAKKSTTTVKYFMKMMANISETIIFMFLGLSTVIDSHDFRLDFVLFSLLFCLVFRVTGVMMLSWLVNQRRLIRLSAIDQFIMSYGGLRGGIAFCLALLLKADHIPERQMFVTTTTVIVFFTVFVQGITIKPVVNALKVERAEEIDTSMNEMIHKRFIDHLMAGVEDIIGKSGHNSIFQRFEYYNNKFLKPWLLREKPKLRDTGILRTYTKLNMQDAKAVAKAFPVSIPRELSMTSLNALSQSPSSAQMHNMGRRATISVPSNRDLETIVNLHSQDPMFQKSMSDTSSMLHDALLEPRQGYLSERRHTLAEIHNRQPPFHPAEPEQLRSLINEIHRGAGINNNNNTATNNNNINSNIGPGFPNTLSSSLSSNDVGGARSNPESPALTGSKSSGHLHPHTSPVYRRLNKNVSFSNPHNRLAKKLSDVAELHPDAAHEVSNLPSEEPQQLEVVFTVGQPAPDKKNTDKGILKVTSSSKINSSETAKASNPSSDHTIPHLSGEAELPGQTSLPLSLEANPALVSQASPQETSSVASLPHTVISLTPTDNSVTDQSHSLPSAIGTKVSSDPIDIPSASNKVELNCQNTISPSSSSIPEPSLQGLTGEIMSSQSSNKSDIDDDKDDDVGSNGIKINDEKHDSKNTKPSEPYLTPDVGTLAETSLPWRRPTSLSPVPSSLSQSLPDDEKPLHSEAPSWADNPAYHHLTESGSPYHSPNTTITAVPQEARPRPVFDIFPATESQKEDTTKNNPETDAASFIPPPWSCSYNDLAGEEESQALPSQSMIGHNVGDKAACMLVSAHDLVPPTHHPCLQPAGPSATSLASSHRHSQASSPLHFQCMEKPETVSNASIEAQIIGIQADYHHGMKDRVSQWLASSPGALPEEEEERLEEKDRIMTSLRGKQEKWALEHETDEGTDADVESDFEEILDTRL
ncbi:sodium/hydrogen exchanger [Plakobranchus ocellatus]|uniref:Sodium/hydrogen exchanger n=1 Tax=Plakobranchus ocellatus TaxID=259542 RepID=A0AAV4AWP6_9GAST|nr:sodium/hydrogen exchanger [Plakobranchus ocellatus]